MKNRNYWVESLGNVLPNQILSEKEVDDIMSISEMEYEYTEHQAHSPSKNDINPLEKTVKKLENDIMILTNYIARLKKVDSADVENGRVALYTKLPQNNLKNLKRNKL